MESNVVTTRDQKPQLSELVRRLPAMLAGRVPDEHGIAAGFKARIGWSIFSLVLPNFNELGRGMTGANGEKWPPLSEKYLAYGRGPKSARQLTDIYKRVYADRLAYHVLRETHDRAKALASEQANKIVKAIKSGTKLQAFGAGKIAGVDYQILVDTGLLRRSLQVGQVFERGPAADYQREVEQVYRDEQTQMVVGTRVPYAAAHHNAKNPKRRRRLWPEHFPADWWRQILDTARGGLVRIVQLFGGSP